MSYDAYIENLNASVPFARHVGVRVEDLNAERGAASLADLPTSKNHVGTLHAGALFTLGEAASGAVVAGIISLESGRVQPVVRSASIAYKKPAQGHIRAEANVLLPAEELLNTLNQKRKVEFDVVVRLFDNFGLEVALMEVKWNFKLIEGQG